MSDLDTPSPSTSNKVSFHIEDIEFDLNQSDAISAWLVSVFEKEDKSLDSLSIILCSDSYLHKLNVEYLQHDTLTDVITFPYSRKDQPVQGDIFISVDRVRDNAKTLNIPFNDELHRVMVHGVLHLAGYGDKTADEAKQIRTKEDFYLAAFQ